MVRLMGKGKPLTGETYGVNPAVKFNMFPIRMLPIHLQRSHEPGRSEQRERYTMLGTDFSENKSSI